KGEAPAPGRQKPVKTRAPAPLTVPAETRQISTLDVADRPHLRSLYAGSRQLSPHARRRRGPTAPAGIPGPQSAARASRQVRQLRADDCRDMEGHSRIPPYCRRDGRRGATHAAGGRVVADPSPPSRLLPRDTDIRCARTEGLALLEPPPATGPGARPRMLPAGSGGISGGLPRLRGALGLIPGAGHVRRARPA